MLKLNTLISAVVLFTAALFQPHANAAELEIELTLPDLDVQPYHRPYVAVWLETPERKHVTTVALWVEKAEWFKDLRQWWRKAGKSDANFDGVTGATKRPGTYTINWNGTDLDGKAVTAGKYLLNLEVVREEGEFFILGKGLSESDKVVLTLPEYPQKGMEIKIAGLEDVAETETANNELAISATTTANEE